MWGEQSKLQRFTFQADRKQKESLAKATKKKEESDKEAEREKVEELKANALTPISECEEGEEEKSHVYIRNGYISLNIEDIKPLITELITCIRI